MVHVQGYCVVALRRLASVSNQSQRLQARVPPASDDDVIVEGDTQRCRGLLHLARHLDVRSRGRGVAGGMIVHH